MPFPSWNHTKRNKGNSNPILPHAKIILKHFFKYTILPMWKLLKLYGKYTRQVKRKGHIQWWSSSGNRSLKVPIKNIFSEVKGSLWRAKSFLYHFFPQKMGVRKWLHYRWGPEDLLDSMYQRNVGNKAVQTIIAAHYCSIYFSEEHKITSQYSWWT